MTATHDLFLSYRTARAAEVAPLVDALRALGVRVWQDVRRVDEGDSISEKVLHGLVSSRALLAFWSDDYALSRICLWELTRAWVLAEAAGAPPTDRVAVFAPPGAEDFSRVGPAADGKRFTAKDGWAAAAVRIQAWLKALSPAPLGDFGPGARPVPWAPHPRASSNRFVGREAELWALHAHLRAGRAVVVSGQARGLAQLRGMGGVGKSLLAVEYANRFEAAWPGGIFWLDAGDGDPERHLQAFALGLGVPAESDPRGWAAAARHALTQRAAPYLWLVDNLPPEATHAQAQAWLAPGATGATLFTTRGRALDALGAYVDLDVLPMDEALRLLRGSAALGAEEEAEARSLLTALGCLPLAVDVLRALVAADREAGRARPFAAWLERLRRADHDALARAPERLRERLPTEINPNVAALLAAAMEGLRPQSWDLLRVVGLLADAPMPRRVVEGALQAADGLSEDDAQEAVDIAVAELEGRSLIRAADGELVVHALVRRAAQRGDADGARVEGLRGRLPEVVTEALGDVADARTHGASAGLVPHAEALLEGEWGVEEARLGGTLAHREHVGGRFTNERGLNEKALEAQLRLLGPEHPATLSALQNLGVSVYAQGDLQGARRLQERAVDVATRVLGPEHPDTVGSLQNLAITLKAQGDLPGARRGYEQALNASTRLLGPEHPQTLYIMMNLAVTLKAQGDLWGARRTEEQAFDIMTRVLGPDHPHTLSILNNLAVTIKSQGDLQGARRRYEQVLDARTRLLGPAHPDTLGTRQNLAITLGAQGELQRARRMLQETHDARTRVLGPEHPDTLGTLQNLAVNLSAQGDFEGAQLRLELVLDARTRLLGLEHPSTLGALQNLAITLFAQGDLEGARCLEERALVVKNRLLGSEHPDTHVSRFNLVQTLREMRDWPAAKAHLLALRPLRDADPDTLSADQREIQAVLQQHFPADAPS